MLSSSKLSPAPNAAEVVGVAGRGEETRKGAVVQLGRGEARGVAVSGGRGLLGVPSAVGMKEMEPSLTICSTGSSKKAGIRIQNVVNLNLFICAVTQ